MHILQQEHHTDRSLDDKETLNAFEKKGDIAVQALKQVYQKLDARELDKATLTPIANWILSNWSELASWEELPGSLISNLEMAIKIIEVADVAQQIAKPVQDNLLDSQHPGVRAAALDALTLGSPRNEIVETLTSWIQTETSTLTLCTVVKIAIDNQLKELVFLIKHLKDNNNKSEMPDPLLDDLCEEFLEKIST